MTTITLPINYRPRTYQLPFLKAMDTGGFNRGVWVAHRRSGKDITCLSYISKKMVERVGLYFYVFPTYAQAKKVIWNGIDKDGKPFMDHFPKELMTVKNDSDMRVQYRNGSIFQLVGSDNVDSIVGTNPVGVVFSEYALQDPRAWGFLRPILAENGGWAIFVGTPRGENHLYDIWELAKADKDKWFSQMDRASETKAIPQDVLDQERREINRLYGNDSLYLQEFECDFSVPLLGAYYADQLSESYRSGRIGHVPHEPRLKVHTAWDLGINDRMAIWFFQILGAEIRVIDYLEDSGKGMSHYIQKILKEKCYVYGRHIAPHDIEVRELTSGISRRDTAQNLGIDFEVCPKLPLNDGISAVREVLPQCWFDKEKCREGLNALKSYRKTWDETRKTYLNQPYHDWASNGSDAFRYFAITHDVINTKSDDEELKARPDKYERARRRIAEDIDYDPMAV